MLSDLYWRPFPLAHIHHIPFVVTYCSLFPRATVNLMNSQRWLCGSFPAFCSCTQGWGDIHISKPACGENSLEQGPIFRGCILCIVQITRGRVWATPPAPQVLAGALFFAFSGVGNSGTCGLHLCSSLYVEVEHLVVYLRVKKILFVCGAEGWTQRLATSPALEQFLLSFAWLEIDTTKHFLTVSTLSSWSGYLCF